MCDVKILDCTLRDGGYCNNWVFEKENIEKISKAIHKAGIDLIEYGYLDSQSFSNIHSTKYSGFSDLPEQIYPNSLLMVNYGEVNINTIPVNSGRIWGIRVAFHKKDKEEALSFCNELIKKRYHVFIQPMVTNSYSEEEFSKLIIDVNHIMPDAFYIVDSFGAMHDEDVKRYILMADRVLYKKVDIGFHGHDNSRLAFLNTVTAISACKNHTLYIDSTIMGMGRGAGNLGTENLIEYFNKKGKKTYFIEPILKVIDEVIYHFYADAPWGYTLPFYLAAKHNCHPNYAQYLDNRKTLTVTGMNKIFERISCDKKVSFDREYIEKLYYQYMSNDGFDEKNKEIWKKNIAGKRILLIAPGKTITEYSNKILRYISTYKPVIINVNFESDKIKADYVFMSNQRRYCAWLETVKNNDTKLIVTSNVSTNNYYLKIKYSSLLSGDNLISDNAGLMAIRFLMQYDIKDIVLAGFDGYQYDEHMNYMDPKMKMETVYIQKKKMNKMIRKEMENMEKQINLKTLTPSLYIDQIFEL